MLSPNLDTEQFRELLEIIGIYWKPLKRLGTIGDDWELSEQFGNWRFIQRFQFCFSPSLIRNSQGTLRSSPLHELTSTRNWAMVKANQEGISLRKVDPSCSPAMHERQKIVQASYLQWLHMTNETGCSYVYQIDMSCISWSWSTINNSNRKPSTSSNQ